MSDSDNPEKPVWLKGDECGTHCSLYDKIAREMGLGENWLEV